MNGGGGRVSTALDLFPVSIGTINYESQDCPELFGD